MRSGGAVALRHKTTLPFRTLLQLALILVNTNTGDPIRPLIRQILKGTSAPAGKHDWGQHSSSVAAAGGDFLSWRI